MKRIKLLSMLAFAAFVAVSFNACKGDDDDNNDGGDNNNNNSYVIDDGDGWMYTLSFSELNDNDSELSFTETYKFTSPEEATLTVTYLYKYEMPDVNADAASADTSAAEEPSSVEIVKDDLPIISAVLTMTSTSSVIADTVYLEYYDDKDYEVEREENKIVCTYTNKYLEGKTYADVKLFYKSEIEYAKEEAKATAKANEQNGNANNANTNTNTNTKTNYNFDKDSVGAIINNESSIGYTIVKSGVASVYSFDYDKDGNITSGTIVCECKNSDVAKAYAKEHMRDKNDAGDRIYKSVSLDGNKVIMIYSDAAIAEMKKSDVENQYEAQKSGKTDSDSNSETENVDGEENDNQGDENQLEQE